MDDEKIDNHLLDRLSSDTIITWDWVFVKSLSTPSAIIINGVKVGGDNITKVIFVFRPEMQVEKYHQNNYISIMFNNFIGKHFS